jgi:hypothetical protein
VRYAPFAFLLFLIMTNSIRAQKLPSFCAQVTPDDLRGLARPYAEYTAADKSQYCEGMLTTGVAAHPVEIVSFKQDAGSTLTFSPNTTASLSWCRIPGVDGPAHLSLRAVKPGIYALDAQPLDKFEWNANLISKTHPDYGTIASLAVAPANIEGKGYSVLLPVRQGPSTAGGYVFMVHSLSPIHLTEANIERVTGGVLAESVPISAVASTAPHIWVVRLSFGTRVRGIYRLSFTAGLGGDGLTSTPVYVAHGGCQ